MRRSALALLLLASAAAACKESSPPPSTAPLPEKTNPGVDETEPNDDSKTAQKLAIPVDVRGKFAAAGDDDWYRLDVTDTQIARVEVAGVAGATPSIEAFDGERNKLLKVTAAAEGEGVAIPAVTCTGTCLFKVASGKKGFEGAYTLTASAKPPQPTSEREPNSRAVDAQKLDVGASVNAWIASGDDEDWYSVATEALPADQVLQVNLASPPGVRLELSVLRPSDQAPLVTWKASEPGQDLRIRDLGRAVAPETGHLLVVKSAWVAVPGTKGKRLFDTKVAYTIDVKGAAGGPDLEQEPNDNAAHATVIDPTKLTRTGYVSPKGDVDVWTITLEQPSILTAEVSGLDKVDLVLSVLDPAKKDEEKDNELAKIDKGTLKEGEILAGLALAAGQNFLKVEGGWKKVDDKYVRDYENVTDPYTLTLQLEPDDGTHEREPNDKADKATPAEVGKEYRGYIHPPGDVDVYSLTVAEAADVALTLSATPKLDLVLVVKDPAHPDERGNPAIVGQVDRTRVEADERLVIPFEPGTYLVEVSEKSKQSNPKARYRLGIK